MPVSTRDSTPAVELEREPERGLGRRADDRRLTARPSVARLRTERAQEDVVLGGAAERDPDPFVEDADDRRPARSRRSASALVGVRTQTKFVARRRAVVAGRRRAPPARARARRSSRRRRRRGSRSAAAAIAAAGPAIGAGARRSLSSAAVSGGATA